MEGEMILATIVGVALIMVGGFYVYDLGFKHGVEVGTARKRYVAERVQLDDLRYFQEKLDRTTDPVQRERLEKMMALFEDSMVVTRIYTEK